MFVCVHVACVYMWCVCVCVYVCVCMFVCLCSSVSVFMCVFVCTDKEHSLTLRVPYTHNDLLIIQPNENHVNRHKHPTVWLSLITFDNPLSYIPV